ncbi:3-hydroxyacyl-CoA dehydrogenase-like protein LAM1, partial [Fusarium oxysporum f. sp. albedinis]
PRDPPREPSPPPKPRAETPPPPPKPKAKPEPKPEPEPEPEPAPAPKAEKSEREKQKGSWEKAREEMRKKEEERKIREAEQKRREEAAKRLAELRAKDAKERQEREKERQRKEQEARDKKERLEAEQRAKELAIKLEEERKERERLEKEAKEAREREAQREKEARELEEKKKKEAEEREARRKKFAAEREALRRKEAEEAKRREEEKKQKELEKQREQERLEKEKAEKERIEREKAEKEKAEKEQAERERAARETADRQRMSYAYSGVGEKISMWPNGRPPAAPKSTTSSASKPPPSAASSQRKPGPAPSAAKSNVSGVSTENSYRPYDKPKQQPKRRGSVSSLGSESSWAASQTTGRTTPPPSTRAGPYSTKDPDKIVISGVYLFMNQFSKTPASQLISGVGTVTDGLILRVTTEGLFIDDDVRNVPQREWDVKTWTLKQVEVWCPPHCLKSPAASSPAPGTKPNPLLYKMASSRARDRGATQPLVGEEADVYLTEMLRACKTCCRLGLCNRTFRDTNITSSTGQTGEWKSKGLHLLRATNREGKRYLFVIDESESWKVSTGLQRLRKSPLAQQLAVSGMAASDARGTLEMLGWA